jgi:hypothetical protein
MADENCQHNTDCKSQSHDQHLCYFVSQGFHLSDAEKYKTMTTEPKYKCQHCGRVANSDQNLCVPVEL